MRRQSGQRIQAVKSTSKPVPGAFAALVVVLGAFAGSSGFCDLSKSFGSSGFFGFSFASQSACGEVLFKNSASGELDPHELQLMNTLLPYSEGDHARAIQTNS